MNANILLIGRAGDESNNLKRELNRHETYKVDLATTPTQAIDTLKSEDINLLVFNTEVLTKKKLSMTAELREVGRGFPVLVLANSIMADTLGDLDRSQSTVILEKPFEVKDLFGLTEKLIGGQSVKQRIFRRFLTNQDGVFFKAPALDLQTNVRIRNLSQGGAYFEYEGRSNVSIGDEVFLDIPLQQIKREYKLKARVVWVTPPTIMGRSGLGVEFIK